MRPIWQIRDFEDSDLDQAVHLWEEATIEGSTPLFRIAEVVAAILAAEPALVAVVDGQVIGTVVTRVSGDRAWILRLAVSPAWHQRGVRSSLLDAVHRELLDKGVRQTTAVFPPGEVEEQLFLDHGFTIRPEVSYFERFLPARPAELNLLAELGGQRMPTGLWDRLKGMDREKQLIERRIILPLAKPTLAEHHGVQPPKAIVLFGPPGTGKTTFAKGIASRLDWPFVELFPSRLAAGGRDGQAHELRMFFHRLAEIDAAVMFIDEVEEIAQSRDDAPVSQAVTNELLKAIPVFRGHPNRLLICATNSIRTLDSAFLRPGRFDHLLPIGPPDEQARLSIWGRYVEGITAAEVGLDALVEASALFTPADMEFAARKAAQFAFERAVFGDAEDIAVTEDFLLAISEVRPTLSRGMVREFEEDIEDFARF
jgi:transitional endoplasmic reticulum ATPase